PARLPALADLEHGRAQFETVAQAHVGLGDATRADVLAERAGGFQHRQGSQFVAPGGVVVERVVVERLVRAAVHARVALFVARQAQPADLHGAIERTLVDRAQAARARVRPGDARQQGLDAYLDGRRHFSAFSRYRASSA